MPAPALPLTSSAPHLPRGGTGAPWDN